MLSLHLSWICESAICVVILDFVQEREILKRAITDLKIELVKERRKIKRIKVCGLVELVIVLSLCSFCLILAIKYWDWLVRWKRLLQLCALLLLQLVIYNCGVWIFLGRQWTLLLLQWRECKLRGHAYICCEQIPIFLL